MADIVFSTRHMSDTQKSKRRINLNDPQSPQKTLNFLFQAFNRRCYVLFLLLAFLAGCLCAGLFINRQRFGLVWGKD